MPEQDGPEYGVNIIQEHSRWSNFFQELRGKVTLEICALSACRVKQFEISAADVVAWGIKIAELMASEAATAKVPIGVSGGDGPEGYVPLFTGPMPLNVEVADQSDVGEEVPDYEYVEITPPSP